MAQLPGREQDRSYESLLKVYIHAVRCHSIQYNSIHTDSYTFHRRWLTLTGLKDLVLDTHNVPQHYLITAKNNVFDELGFRLFTSMYALSAIASTGVSLLLVYVSLFLSTDSSKASGNLKP